VIAFMTIFLLVCGYEGSVAHRVEWDIGCVKLFLQWIVIMLDY
jgi:hypothetical protein